MFIKKSEQREKKIAVTVKKYSRSDKGDLKVMC